MRGSTTQNANKQQILKVTPEEAKQALEDMNLWPFERELTKKVRNKKKKVREIDDLMIKVKKKEIDPTDQQRQKIESRAAVELEISEVESYLQQFKETEKTWQKTA